MGALLRLMRDDVAPEAGTRLLKAEEYSRLLEARDILEEARRRAVEMDAAAAAACEQRKQQGYEDGLLEGRAQQAEKMLETTLLTLEYIESLEKKMVDIVVQAVRKIVGELPDDERVVRVVRTALEAVRGQQRVTVRVCPADEPAVSKALAAMTATLPHGPGFLDVRADSRMQSGDCILESELGVVDAGLETQLKAISRALENKVTVR